MHAGQISNNVGVTWAWGRDDCCQQQVGPNALEIAAGYINGSAEQSVKNSGLPSWIFYSSGRCDFSEFLANFLKSTLHWSGGVLIAVLR
jgi:hypothetical protein